MRDMILHIPFFRLFLVLALALSAMALPSAAAQDVDTVDYSNPFYWYACGSESDKGAVDVFFVLPTCVHDWKDSTGRVCHYASLTDAKQRSVMGRTFELARSVFADSARFFAPFYRQVTSDVWKGGELMVDSCFPRAMDDVRRAFDLYLRHHNHGRPFVLAGHSQGAKCVVELLKSMDSATASLLVAAYVCGYKVTPLDTMDAPFLRPARRADDVGVAVVYNSVVDTSFLCPLVSSGNMWVINPASWTCDPGTHLLNDSVSVSIDTVHKVLVVSGVDPSAYFRPSMEALFPLGNLHLAELKLYADALRANIRQRIAAYRRVKN